MCFSHFGNEVALETYLFDLVPRAACNLSPTQQITTQSQESRLEALQGKARQLIAVWTCESTEAWPQGGYKKILWNIIGPDIVTNLNRGQHAVLGKHSRFVPA